MSLADASPRVRAPASMEPVTYRKATRQLIFDKSINPSWSPYNQHIRRSLGFRETSAGGKGKPVFASKNVDRLYAEINHMAQKLPNHSHDELKRAWEGQIYAKDVKGLVDRHGEGIWGDTLEDRKLSSNPKSQLLTAEDGSEAGNLFYKYERHREFIALQLEHLLFLKAIAVYHNYYGPYAPRAAQSTRSKASNPQESSSIVVTPRKECLVIFRLPAEKLRAILFRNSERIAERKRALEAAGRGLLNNVSSDSEGESTPTKRRRLSKRYRRVITGHVTEEDNPPSSGQTSEVDENSTVATEGNGALAVEPKSEEAKRSMRIELAMLLYRELCHDDEASHARLRDAKSMLAKSKYLDSIILMLRRQGEDTLRESLGDSFEHDVQTLDAWLSWREGCWLLSEATGVHPFSGQPTPRFTVEQWKTMLGGAEKCRKIHQTLLGCGQRALSIHDGKDKTTSSTANSLAQVFAAMAKSPMLKDSLPCHMVAHNKLLSSWKLDFWV